MQKQLLEAMPETKGDECRERRDLRWRAAGAGIAATSGGGRQERSGLGCRVKVAPWPWPE
jgi:hypothetical protein